MSYPMQKQKVTILMGSPRRNSNTHLLVREAERALCERGIPTVTVFPDDLVIRDCRGCHGCKQDRRATCGIQDDMQDIYPLIEQSAGIIVAAPVYFGYVPSMTKAWLDRLVPYIGTDLRPNLPTGKYVSFIFTQNMPDAGLFMPALQSFMDAVAMTGLSVRDCLVVTDCEAGSKPLVTERPDVMERAFALGRDLVE